MITIDQLLESVDLDFEPRWVTKDLDGGVSIWEVKPVRHDDYYGLDDYNDGEVDNFGKIRLSEFVNKHWTDCIYEVPQKTTGKIERFIPADFATIRDINEYVRSVLDSRALDRLNMLVDAVNELKGAKNDK